MALVREAGWNQTEADWSRMLRLGRGFGIRDEGGAVIASSVIMPYAGLGWIGMVLVHGPYRRRGLATRLLAHAIERLRDRSLVPWLDATPAGRPVYAALGFAAVAPIERWRGQGRGKGGTDALSEEELAGAEALDALALGGRRPGLLRAIAASPGSFALRGAGYVFARPGRTATQIGPLLAAGDAAPLLERALDVADGPVLLDLPCRETALADLLKARGFSVERPFTRMALGAPAGIDMGPALRVIAGPELG
jgi:GNAT superfamily N-acetyltransferase